MADLVMISLLLALSLSQLPDTAPSPPDSRTRLQPCERTSAGWLCSYRTPAVIVEGTPPGTVVISDPPIRSVPEPSGRSVPPTAPPAEITTAPPLEVTSAEADRQARLIARCADASWLSLCLPDDRREARILRDAAVARAALRREVYQMLSENRCDDAMRTALASADLALVWEVRNLNVCAPNPAAAEAPADSN